MNIDKSIVEFHQERIHHDADLLIVTKTLLTDIDVSKPTKLQSAFLKYAEQVLGHGLNLAMAQNLIDYSAYEKTGE